MLEVIIDFWFLIIAASIIFTVYDIRNTPVSWVQKLGWVLVVLYTGPIGVLFYWLSCRSSTTETHAIYTQPTWKQSINSEVHCIAGDATGIIIAAIFLSYVDMPRGIELALEYIAGFLCGWLIFQAGMMKSMYGSYKQALTNTFFAEAVSMNCVMLGMIPTMIILGYDIPDSMKPSSLHFWFVMGMATVVGGLTAYPINYWLVKNKLKHGCMTLEPEITSEIQLKTDSKHDAHAHHDHAQATEEHGKIPHTMMALSKKQEQTMISVTFAAMLIVTIIAFFFTR